jgi:mannose-6-phosphate isomerase-like protein (cupin superfamily)
MDVKPLRDARRFSAEKMVKSGVFATERLYYDLYCLEPGQAQKVHAHDTSDKVYLVLDGKALVTLGTEERELGPEEAVLCPAGSPHGVRNGSAERVTLLVVTTPPPR